MGTVCFQYACDAAGRVTTTDKFPSPFHWAPFCLQGDYR
jgi:hypothetical protein